MEMTQTALTQELKAISQFEIRNLAHVVCHLHCMKSSLNYEDVSAYVAEYKRFLLSVGVDQSIISRIILSGVIQGANEYQMLLDSGSSIVQLLQESPSHSAHTGSFITPSMSPNIAFNAEDLAYICKDLNTVLI